MSETKARLNVNKKLGEAIREYRREHRLTIANFLGSVGREAQKFELNASIDDAFISRLESGKIGSTRADNLTAIALAMGLPNVDQLMALGSADKYIPTRIGTVHAIWAAPLIAAANRLTMRGATLTSFGYQEGGHFKAMPSVLDPNGQRKIFHTAPNYKKSAEGWDRPDSVTEQLIWQDGKTRLCAAPEIDILWREEEIDIAAISREVFRAHLGRRASREGIIIGTISQSARAAKVVALIDPFVAFPQSTEISDQAQVGPVLPPQPKTLKDTITTIRTQTDEFLENCHEIAKRHGDTRALSIMCPEGTFSVSEIHRLSWVRVRQDKPPLTAESYSLSDYDTLREKAFHRARTTGIAMLTLWEPFSTYVRTAWENDVEKRSLTDLTLCRAVKEINANIPPRRYLAAEEKFNFSVNFSLASMFSAAGEPFNPLFPLDIIVARDYLEKGEPADIALKQLFDTLEGEIGQLREASERFSEISVTSWKAEPDSVAKRMAACANEPIKALTSAFRLSVAQTFHALSEVEFGLTFDRSFVNYLWN